MTLLHLRKALRCSSKKAAYNTFFFLDGIQLEYVGLLTDEGFIK